MVVRVHVCTRRSRTHERNEDRAVIGDRVVAATDGVEHEQLQTPAIVAVLDGLGGHPAGDVASELAGRLLAQAEPRATETPASELLHEADLALQDAMRDVPERFGMGATVAMLAIADDEHAIMANVGDSSVWQLVSGDRLAQLSVLDRSEGRAILQCLGARDDRRIAPHTERVWLGPGEPVLLASDGLTDVVAAERIEEALREDPSQAAERLLEAVEAAGTPDDVTIVIVEPID